MLSEGEGGCDCVFLLAGPAIQVNGLEGRLFATLPLEGALEEQTARQLAILSGQTTKIAYSLERALG